jgi:hypothetical protein
MLLARLAAATTTLGVQVQKYLLISQTRKILMGDISRLYWWCKGTTAKLGYLEVLELFMEFLLLGQLASVRTVNSQWGRRIEFLY